MKNLKLVALLVAATAALFALAGAGTASATVLCTEAKTPCPKDFPAETKVTLTLQEGTSAAFKDTSGNTLTTCTGTSISGTTSNTGGKETAVKSAASEWTFKNCSQTVDVVKTGEVEVSYITGTNNGTVTARNYELTIVVFGVSCAYGPGTGLDLGTLVGGTPATISINTVLPKTSGGFLCPVDGIWEAKYAATSPSPLFIEAE